MAKLTNAGKKKTGIIKLKVVAKKLQQSLSLGKKSSSYFDDGEVRDSTCVPKGHFAVIAVDGDEPKRFVVPLSFLTHPSFLRLLEQAAEEYGFYQEGALAVPCQPVELERILAEDGVDVNWGSYGTMVQSF